MGFRQRQAGSERYTRFVTRFRDRLLATLRAAEPVLDVSGVLVAGSEVPNLLEHHAESTLVVSQDVDIAVPIGVHAEVKRRLASLHGLARSPDEPSVWVPESTELLEVNFIGMNPDVSRAGETYVLDDPDLPLLVFGNLSFLRPREPVLVIEGLQVPLPRCAGLLLEKLVTDRTSEKGDRDLLVVLGLLLVATPSDEEELVQTYATLSGELQHAIRANLTVLSLMQPHTNMPDPTLHRARVGRLLRRLEAAR
jgi:hypothetical protein